MCIYIYIIVISSILFCFFIATFSQNCTDLSLVIKILHIIATFPSALPAFVPIFLCMSSLSVIMSNRELDETLANTTLNFGQLLFHLQPEEKKIVRKIEKVSYKINAADTAIVFNNTCLKEGLLPKYTNLRLHDPTASSEINTWNFRKNLVSRQLQTKKEEKASLSDELRSLHQEWDRFPTDPVYRRTVQDALEHLRRQDYSKKEKNILQKLIRLNGGRLKIPKQKKNYINLSNYQPSGDEEALLQLGLNCHYINKVDPKKKRLEVEVLLDSILSLEKKGDVRLNDSLQPLLLAEALTDRSNHRSDIMNPRLREASKRLKQAEGITIRRADKTAALVLIPTDEYHHKLDEILSDDSKFQRITRNPIEDIKREANRIIERVNAASNSTHLPLIKGDYDPGYLYGNVKTHKNNNPLRPIISQIPTPTYALAKALNRVLTPFIPQKYSIKSPVEFLEIIKSAPTNKIIASLDVESLFTNVPVDETINLILDRVYRNDETPTLEIPEEALRNLLHLCTKRAPFTTHKGQMFTQVDGVAMGSPLGVLFANFYMGIVEERVFSSIPTPHRYCRYIDDTFVVVEREKDIEDLIDNFQQQSVLRFTSEKSENGKLPFLDVLISNNEEGFNTSVYRKPTNIGLCLNGESECPENYRRSVIDTYVRRALTHCSTWQLTNQEIEHATQILVNNGFSNKEIQRRIRVIMDKWYLDAPRTDPDKTIKLFYKGYFHKKYREDEKVIKKIIQDNVTPTDPSAKVHLNIYYNDRKTSQILLKNNPSPPPEDMKRRNVVYQFTCPEVGCSHSYIGLTTTKLTKRVSCHLQEGNIYKHFTQAHNKRPSRNNLIESTKILDSAQDPKRLKYLEALHILDKKPSLNVTQETLLLPTTLQRRIT